MKQALKTVVLFIIFIVVAFVSVNAQDVIIKNDKTEIKAKVVEITEVIIKYRKWENLDGPLYNISKTEVFMIIYENGQREIIQKTGIKSSQSAIVSTNSSAVSESNRSGTEKQGTQKVNYKPTRITIGFQLPLSIGIDQEIRIIKNLLNMGVDYEYSFPKDKYVLESHFGSIYVSIYAPLNRLMANFANQDKGFFVFGQAGYGQSYAKILNYYDGDTETILSGGFTWRIGVDYFLTNNIGITMSTYEFKTFLGGVVFKL